MKKINWLGIVVVYSAFSQVVYANTNNRISCEVKHSLYHADFAIKATYKFIMSDNAGVILINGSSHLGAEKYTISREIHFGYKRQSGDDFFLSSNVVHKNPLDTLPDSLSLKHYPGFFVHKNNRLTFSIKPVNETDYIISFVSTPLFYCNGK